MHFFWRKFKGEFDIISPVKISDTFKLFLASGFFLGLSPIVPGSFGALSGLAWHYTAWHFQWDPMHIRIWCLTGAVFFSAIVSGIRLIWTWPLRNSKGGNEDGE